MTQWFYLKGGNPHGPISGVQLQAMVRSGSLQPTDLVRREGLTKWLPASKVKGLFAKVPSPADPPLAKSPTTGPLPIKPPPTETNGTGDDISEGQYHLQNDENEPHIASDVEKDMYHVPQSLYLDTTRRRQRDIQTAGFDGTRQRGLVKWLSVGSVLFGLFLVAGVCAYFFFRDTPGQRTNAEPTEEQLREAYAARDQKREEAKAFLKTALDAYMKSPIMEGSKAFDQGIAPDIYKAHSYVESITLFDDSGVKIPKDEQDALNVWLFSIEVKFKNLSEGYEHFYYVRVDKLGDKWFILPMTNSMGIEDYIAWGKANLRVVQTKDVLP